jgi:hypothetical protein
VGLDTEVNEQYGEYFMIVPCERHRFLTNEKSHFIGQNALLYGLLVGVAGFNGMAGVEAYKTKGNGTGSGRGFITLLCNKDTTVWKVALASA